MGGLFLAEFGYPLGACLLSGIAQGEAQFLEICPSEERSYKYFIWEAVETWKPLRGVSHCVKLQPSRAWAGLPGCSECHGAGSPRPVPCTPWVATHVPHFSVTFANVRFKECGHTLRADWALPWERAHVWQLQPWAHVHEWFMQLQSVWPLLLSLHSEQCGSAGWGPRRPRGSLMFISHV